MKDVISVEEMLRELTWLTSAMEHGEYTGDQLEESITDLSKKLHSLLISKLPEKRPTIEQFRGTDLKYDAGAFDGYNKCLDDMHRVIDEMFEVHNEK